MSHVKLQKEHLRLVEQNFYLLDTNNDRKLNKREAGVLFRALGQIISNKELDKVLDEGFRLVAQSARLPTPGKKFEASSKSNDEAEELVDFDGFIRIFESSYKTPISTDVIIEGIQLFDPERTGKMKLATLQKLLTSLNAEPLSNDDLRDILKLAESFSQETWEPDEFDYVAFIHKLGKGHEP